MTGPFSRRSSGLIAPMPFSRPEIVPDLPRAATRSSSTAAAVSAAPIALIRSSSSWFRSVMSRSL
jgi:hypothetical protein